MTRYYICKTCDYEIECSVTINEECDLPTTCPECNATIPDIAYSEMQEQAIERAIDSADRYND